VKISSLLKIERTSGSLQNIDVLFTLYLHIIGQKSVSLYQYLYFCKTEVRLATILQALEFNLSDFEQARTHLEAIQLLDTYEVDNHFVLVTKSPLSKTDFLKQPALYQLITAKLGVDYVREFHSAQPLGQNISKKFNEVYIEPQQQSPKEVADNTQVMQFKQNNVVIEGLTDDEQKVIKIAQAIEPQDFLATLRHQFKGYVTDDEIGLIEQLKNERKINPELINLVIYLSLGREKQPKLVRKFVDTVILDWQAKNVQTAAGAMARIKEKEQKATTTKRTYTKAPINKVGQIPSWANERFDKKVSEQEMAELNARMDRFNT
jgi:replication initiation and membrane attachment protein DnaB